MISLSSFIGTIILLTCSTKFFDISNESSFSFFILKSLFLYSSNQDIKVDLPTPKSQKILTETPYQA